MGRKQVHHARNDVECARCANSQTAASVNPAEIWSSLVELGGKNSVVKEGGLYFNAVLLDTSSWIAPPVKGYLS